MNDIWNKDPAKWNKLSLWDRLYAMMVWHTNGPCGQSASVIGTRDTLEKTIIEAGAEIVKASQFRDEVIAALIECQDYDRLRNRLMGLIERTAKPQRAD